MTEITTTTAANGMAIHCMSIPGTRALTALVAFDAGARSERPEENGIAHFMEHLVFKGGVSYPTYRDVNETAERMGASINAFTSHDIVAFHATVRAEGAPASKATSAVRARVPGIDMQWIDRPLAPVVVVISVIAP